MLNPWWARGVILAANIAMIAIRAPHGKRSRTQRISLDRQGRLESALLTIATVAWALPLVWVATPWLSFAEYPSEDWMLAPGALLIALGLWLFARSHADLGLNWSVSLQVRAHHTLVTRGVYRRIRHPMYTALLIFSLGHVLALPNWVAGPAYLIAMLLLISLRLGPEERLMHERFGVEYSAYQERSKRLIPGVW
ncbi:protein-S-isoprenylcysteine O-methyltransferase [soil metagenome]